MPRRERTVDRRATLYVRENLPRPASQRCESVADELAAVAASGSIDAFDVVHWAKRVPESGHRRERTLAERFGAWADAEGVDLAPCFETRRCYVEGTDEMRTELVMPVCCLAVYERDAIVDVAPHARAGEIVTVTDLVDRLREAPPVEPDDESPEERDEESPGRGGGEPPGEREGALLTAPK